ncbi:MMPL family transporter [Aeromicrobium sp. Leaf350]|uniref:MMPL family transporter n=1 Tax=Aeromicrobium sp. Leaf350 TaxID=2876565 RepID=UPI001E48140D|nr:MMPL family transporter [Aeromicrobium sp. Leaf350]
MSLSLTERISAHPRRTLAALVLFLVVAGVFGGSVAGALDSDGGFVPDGAESAAAMDRLTDATGAAAGPGIVVLVDADAQTSADEVAARLSDLPGVARAEAPPGAGPDTSTALVLATLEGDANTDTVAADAVELFGDEPGIEVGGPDVAFFQISEAIGEDLARAELLALPILVVLSILFFRGRAAWLPLIVGLTTVLGTFLVLAGINQVYGLSVFALNLVIGLGLGLAIDYTLFLVTRYREELERQGPTAGAIRTTMRTAGRTVVFSAATVAVALATLTVFPLGFLVTMGIAGAAVAVVAGAAALLVTPALLALWGAKLARKKRADGVAGETRWYRFSHAVMRRPGGIAIVTTLVMLALALPALRVEWTPIDSTVIPEGQSARTVADRLDAAGDTSDPVVVALSDTTAAGAEDFAAEAADLTGVDAVAEPVQLDDTTWQLAVTADGPPQGDTAQGVVAELRDLPADGTVEVGGAAAEFVDQQAAIGDRLPLALGMLLVLTVLVLWLMTGSVILPIKAVVMNVLTVGTALGALIFVYQDGRFTELLGYTSNGGIEPTDFLVAAALVFALSTDYGVFLLGRIKEARDSGVPEREAVAVGLGRTGSVVTAAAILLAVAIGAFSTSSISFIQQIGVATAVGVLVDAFIVRSLLVPSLMALMGRWNWWSPPALRRLHDRIGLSEGESPVVAAPAPVALPEPARTP